MASLYRRLREAPAGFSTGILGATAAYLAISLIALAAWRATGDVAWVTRFFQAPGAMLLVWLAMVELFLSLRVCRQFSPGEEMRSAWQWIAFSSACNLAGAVYVQVLSVESSLNPLTYFPGWWAPSAAAALRQFGLILGGTFRFLLLAGGLAKALRVYRRPGFLGRLARMDWVVLAAVAAYIAGEFWDVAAALGAGKRPGVEEVLAWPVDPLLWLLLAEAMLIRRSIQQMGHGWITRCWGAISTAVFLTTLGNVSLWAVTRGYLPWPWNAITWYVWLPAACAYALGPAYQLETIRQASACYDRPRGLRHSA